MGTSAPLRLKRIAAVFAVAWMCCLCAQVAWAASAANEHVTVSCEAPRVYIEAVVNGCSLLRIDDSFDRAYVDADTIRVITRGSERLMNVCVIAKKEDASSKQDEYELSIDGNQIVAVLTNGIVKSLSRDGARIEMPEKNLLGNPDWRKLSGKFLAEALRHISFIKFLGLDGNANATQFSVIGRNVAPQTFEYVCGKSGLFRQVEYHTNGDIMRIYECVSRNGVDALRFGNE